MIDEKFRAVVIHLDGLVLVTIAGDIDIETAPSVELALRRAISRRSKRVVVNLAKVTLVGSDAIRAVVRASKSAEAAGVSLKLVGVTPLVQRVLDATDAGNVLCARGSAYARARRP